MRQTEQIMKLLKVMGIGKSISVGCPVNVSFFTSTDKQERLTSHENIVYRSVVWSLLYLATHIRTDQSVFDSILGNHVAA